jgi:hypothetical protein
MRSVATVSTTLLGFLVIGLNTSQAGEGRAEIEAGYVLVDEVGSRAVNQETYNLYEGLGLSIREFQYRLNPDWRVSADLRNLTLNNRNLEALVSNRNRLALALHHHKYRRQYDHAASSWTRRSTTSADLTVRPVPRLEFFGGATLTDKRGSASDVIAVTNDRKEVDYRHLTYRLGGRYKHRQGTVLIRFRHFDFDNYVSSEHFNTGRRAGELHTHASLNVPGLEWLYLSGGYDYRRDQIDFNETELTTNLGWAGLKAYLPADLYVDYLFSFARTLQSTLDQETDNVTNTAAVGKTWRGVGGLRLGYENRISDDLVDRTVSNGLLLDGWFSYRRHLSVRASISFRDQNVADGTTLIGDRNVSRQRVSVKYRADSPGSFEVQWISRISRHDPAPHLRGTVNTDDFATRIDYDGISTIINLSPAEYGTATCSYTYYLGRHQNNSARTDYEFSDHVFRADLNSRNYRGLELSGTGTYYRSRRDRDTEKFQIGFRAAYDVTADYRVGVEYNVFNFDDLITSGYYYTANVVRLFVRKNVAF